MSTTELHVRAGWPTLDNIAAQLWIDAWGMEFVCKSEQDPLPSISNVTNIRTTTVYRPGR